MADKNLDDLMKDLNKYTVQVAEEKKQEQAKAYKRPFIFPWKWVILALIAAGWHFRAPIKILTIQFTARPEVSELMQMLDASSGNAKSVPGALDRKREALNGIEGTTPQLPEGSERMPAAKNVERDIVQIEGKWYKKTPDNIYFIKGRRVLFIDNRRATGGPNIQPNTQ